MGISHLHSIFKPQRIALIGVKNDPNSVGGITLKNLVGGGFNGVVYPVNPKHEAVLGIQCYPNVRSLPKTPDLAVITTGSNLVPGLVKECGEAGIFGIIIMSAGFKETGEEGKKLEQELKQVVASFPKMRVIGPNCLGIIVPRLKMNVSFASGMPKDGHVAFISQSGALCTSVLDWSYEENIGFSYFVSIGNSMDVEFGDLIDYFGMDPQTKSIVLYVESISEARKFMTAARAFARKKPIIVYKAGRFPESAKAAASHTGAMASEDTIYDAVFQRAGIARVYDIGDIFDFTDLISRRRIPKGSNLAIVTNAGGPGVMATDTLIANKGELVKLSDETMDKLNEALPPFWSHGNPVDVLGDATPERFAKATEIVLQDPGVDAVLAILTPQAMTDPTRTALEISRITEHTTKPIMTAWLGGKAMRDGIQIFNNHNLANYATPEQAISAFMTLADYSQNLNALFETPKDIPVSFPYDRKKIREEITARIREQMDENGVLKNKIISEDASKNLLEIYGITTTRPHLARTKEEAVEIAEKIGYPVVLKIQSPEISHKTDVGGVSLNNRSKESLLISWDRMMARVKEKRPDATIDGITIQQMVQEKDSVELILGVKKDPIFGTVILIGMGGIVAELFKDRALGFPPLNEALALNMLKSLKIYPLLTGYRGASKKNTHKLIEIMIRMSYLAADYPEIAELDINPLLVGTDNVVALDARIVIDEDIMKHPIPSYSHLILHPYPEEYVKEVTLVDGTTMTFRPIKPEDEPLWLEMLASCSKESIYSRFRYDFHFAEHEIATQFCVIDYAREIAIVAEVQKNGEKKLAGVGRLIANLDVDMVEYAILITDAWQRKDLGNLLTKYCMDVAKHWGLKRIVAETTVDNKPMIAVFKKYGFSIHFNSDGSVNVSKDMAEYEQTYFFDNN
jgi:acetyltransferase